jgi:hypothetical protein
MPATAKPCAHLEVAGCTVLVAVTGGDAETVAAVEEAVVLAMVGFGEAVRAAALGTDAPEPAAEDGHEPAAEPPPAADAVRTAARATGHMAAASSTGADPPVGTEFERRVTAAREHGVLLAAALLADRPEPATPELPLGLRNRLWVAVGGARDMVGIYRSFARGADRSLHVPPSCVVGGFPSLAEARAFGSGMGVDLPDRRRETGPTLRARR